MYAILKWIDNDNLVVPIFNKQGGIRLFMTLREAEDFTSNRKDIKELRLINIDEVKK